MAVFSGHNCVFVPFSSWACDHLEEMVFPLETWGKHFFVAMTHPVQDGTDETNMVRILSGEDAVTVTFTPSSVSAPVTLDKGGFVELMPPPGTDFEVTSTGIAGSHRISAPNATIKFGIEVYGFASYTSYLYPGGLDLEYINPIGK
ncbi:IgGFc-binding protein [Myxococcota bacterium]|nr:IgGFc-binding protein [Myxococcota bacterium]MBU1410100.1 IgGFc-binding protein [Myxococcota bacterium]MBU1508926.1 IgGFc-binding protein [Myxococcota bacterium]